MSTLFRLSRRLRFTRMLCFSIFWNVPQFRDGLWETITLWKLIHELRSKTWLPAKIYQSVFNFRYDFSLDFADGQMRERCAMRCCCNRKMTWGISFASEYWLHSVWTFIHTICFHLKTNWKHGCYSCKNCSWKNIPRRWDSTSFFIVILVSNLVSEFKCRQWVSDLALGTCCQEYPSPFSFKVSTY